MEFLRFMEIIRVKQEKRVVSIAVRPTIRNTSGAIWYTDMQVQEGGRLTGYTPHTRGLLGGTGGKHFFNGIVRSGDTIVIPNLGETSAGLDIYLYPVQAMEANSLSLSQGGGSQKMAFLSSVSAGDTFALLTSQRACLRNGSPIRKKGFFQYSAAQDSKHQVYVPKHKSVRAYFEYREQRKGVERF